MNKIFLSVLLHRKCKGLNQQVFVSIYSLTFISFLLVKAIFSIWGPNYNIILWSFTWLLNVFIYKNIVLFCYSAHSCVLFNNKILIWWFMSGMVSDCDWKNTKPALAGFVILNSDDCYIYNLHKSSKKSWYCLYVDLSFFLNQ